MDQEADKAEQGRDSSSSVVLVVDNEMETANKDLAEQN